jgi:glycosyltransferase involved in cell wall biosynthesis
MTTLLTFQHRHAQILNAAPARLQAASIMPIAREVLSIPTATMPTSPINRSRLSADMSYLSLLASQFGAHLCFQEHFYHGFDRPAGCGFGLLVDFFQNGLSPVFFQFPLLKVYSHTTDPSWWLSLLFFFTLPRGGLQFLFAVTLPPFFLPLARDTLPEILARCGIDTARPLITQVSRFGIWKNPWQVVDIYHQVKQQMLSVQLAMVGAMEAKDDVKAMEILTDLQQHYVNGDPDIHLLSDPILIDHEAVNAFQRYSSVILQRSIREGFGFTVTEALWKNQPVIGTCVTGLQMQIAHGYNGYLVDDTEVAAGYTLDLLQDRDLWRKLGENAHESVRKQFLFPTMILCYLQALARVQAGSPALVEPETALTETTEAVAELAA